MAQQKGQGRPGEFRDSHIWKEGDSWYMAICSGSASSNGGSVLLYTTDRLELKFDGTVDMDWQYKGVVYEIENQSALYGTSWELPIILPVTNEAGTITKYIFSISPAPASIADNKVYYWIGDFDPASGNIYMFSIMRDQRGAAEQGASGWAHTAGIARRIWLSDDGTDLMMAPIETLQDLEKEVLIDETNLTLDAANSLLASHAIDLFAEGNMTIESLYVASMGSIFE